MKQAARFMESAIFRVVFAFLAMGTAVLMPGCLVTSRSHSRASGKMIDPAEMRSIEVGRTTGDELIERFGAPTSRVDRKDGTSTWKWCRTESRESSGRVFLVFGSSRDEEKTSCTVVDLRDGVVTGVRSE
jgi:hypothetical protein